MRVIKFRAWDTTSGSGKMVPWEDKGMQKSEVWAVFLPATIEMLEVKLMQFTGLLDKNGKEIFEGDIVSCPAYWGGPPSKTPKLGASFPVVAEIKYREYQFVMTEPQYCRSLRASNGNSTDWYRGYCDITWSDDIEVIGNIHENPELLENNE